MSAVGRTDHILMRAARWLVLCAVVIAPWLFGAAETWACLLVCLGVGLGGIIWLFSLSCAREPRMVEGGVLLAAAAFMVYVVLQIIPLPDWIVGLLSPSSAAVQRESFDLLSRFGVLEFAAGSGGARSGLSLSVAPSATGGAAAVLLACAVTLIVTLNTVTHWRHVAQCMGVLVVSGFLLAAVGIVHKLSDSDALFWFHHPRYGGTFMGSFSNRNHFAAYLNVMLGLAAGFFMAIWRTQEREGMPEKWRDRLLWFSTENMSRLVLVGFSILVMASAIVISLSRGAIAALAAALAVVFAFGVRSKRSVFAATLIAAAAVLMVMWLGWEPVAARLGTIAGLARDPLANSRAVASWSALMLYGLSPMAGWGFGTFRHVFPMFQVSDLLHGRFLHAHNDWLQLLAEGGLVGALLFLGVVAALGWSAVRWFRQAGPRGRAVAGGICLGLAAMAIHSFVDYALRKPACSLLVSMSVGLALAALRISARHGYPEMLIEEGGAKEKACGHEAGGRPGRKASLRVAAVALLVVILGMLLLHLEEFRGALASARLLHLSRMAEKSPDRLAFCQTVADGVEEMRRMIRYSPGNSDALKDVVATGLRWISDARLDQKPELRGLIAENCLKAAVLSVRSAPSDYLSWLWLGRTFVSIGQWDEAEQCLGRARELVYVPDMVRLLSAPR